MAAGSHSASASCYSAGFLLPSSFTAQPARKARKHTPDTGQLFGVAAIANIWIPSCVVTSTSKREFRRKGGEIPLRRLFQPVV